MEIYGLIIVDQNKKCCKRAYIRVLFGRWFGKRSGKILPPEIVTHNETYATALSYKRIRSQCQDYWRKSYYVVYLKDGGHIVDFILLAPMPPYCWKISGYKDIK